MSPESKFDRFSAKTPTELMLHNEIKRLQRVNYMLICDRGIPSFQEFKRETVPIGYEPPPVLSLQLSARVLGQIDEQGRLSVDARSYGKDRNLAFAYYLSPEVLVDSYFLADVLMHKHEELMHSVAEQLAK